MHVPVYQITAKGDYSKLATFLETLLTQLWYVENFSRQILTQIRYPTTVATLSRRCRDIFEDGFHKSVEDSASFLLDSRLHDFGFRGCTCVEQSIIGGCAHLLNFVGSDTMSACFYAQFNLNNGVPIAESIPATEHRYLNSSQLDLTCLL